jgi:hypothetical protein
MSGRTQLLALLFFALPSLNCVLLGNESDSLKVQVKYCSNDDFLRISEYFSGKEYTGNNLVLRSSPNDRSGLYFYLPVILDRISTQKGNKIKLDVIDSTDPQSRSFYFTIPNDLKGKKRVLLGLTGKDWGESNMRLVAWKIQITGLEEKSIFVEKSSLWSH